MPQTITESLGDVINVFYLLKRLDLAGQPHATIAPVWHLKVNLRYNSFQSYESNMSKPIGLGNSDFKKMIDEELLFVDKE